MNVKIIHLPHLEVNHRNMENYTVHLVYVLAYSQSIYLTLHIQGKTDFFFFFGLDDGVCKHATRVFYNLPRNKLLPRPLCIKKVIDWI